jgi:soluble lytic murein transglycosylase-like protein
MEPPHSIRVRETRAIPRGAALWLGIAAGIWIAAAPAWAGGRAIYAYTDAQGVTHFTNRPHTDKRFKRVHLSDRVSAPKHHRAPHTRAYDPLIDNAATSEGLPPALVKAVIAAESAFDSDAVSHKGAKGLMQLMPETAHEMGVANPLEPAENVRGGTSYLRAMIDRYGDLGRALAAYNAGPTAVDRYGGIPPFRETQDYVERVLAYYRRYHGDFAR